MIHDGGPVVDEFKRRANRFARILRMVEMLELDDSDVPGEDADAGELRQYAARWLSRQYFKRLLPGSAARAKSA